MRRDYHDTRLCSVQGLACGLCRRDAAPTGRFCEMLPSHRWKLELKCPHCHQTSLIPATDHPAIYRVIQDSTAARYESCTISGEIGVAIPAPIVPAAPAGPPAPPARRRCSACTRPCRPSPSRCAASSPWSSATTAT